MFPWMHRLSSDGIDCVVGFLGEKLCGLVPALQRCFHKADRASQSFQTPGYCSSLSDLYLRTSYQLRLLARIIYHNYPWRETVSDEADPDR